MNGNSINDKSRLIGIDVLKIIAMFMICLLHFVGKAGLLESTDSTTRVIAYTIKSFSIVAVNVYIMATGYLSSTASYEKGKNKKKILHIWLQTLFYSVVIYVVVTAYTGFSGGGVTSLIKSFFPVISMEYWYVSSYILLLLFIPFLNEGIAKLSNARFINLIILILIVFSAFHTLLPSNGLLETGYIQGYGIVWMICMYLVGAFIRKNSDTLKEKNRALFIIGYILISALIAVIVSANHGSKNSYIVSAFDYNNLLVCVSSILFFNFFATLTNERKRISIWLGHVSRATLAVYLIQEQFVFKNYLWKWIYSISEGTVTSIRIIVSIVMIVAFMGICIVVETIRARITKKANIEERVLSTLDRIKKLSKC